MLSLFSGIGGIDLAAEWAGIDVVAFCEREPFCQKVLEKNFPGIPIFDDVCTLNKQTLEGSGIDGTIDIVAGGFPCQPFSIGGKKKGWNDERALWGEMFRIIQEFRPRWVVGENVAHFIKLGVDDVLVQLEKENYTTRTFILPASSVGAIHKRDRVFMVAHSNSEHEEWSIEKEIQRKRTLQREFPYGSVEEWTRRSSVYEPKLCRTHNGIPNQMDRNKAIGNAVVPQQIYPIFKAISEIENGGINYVE